MLLICASVSNINAQCFCPNSMTQFIPGQGYSQGTALDSYYNDGQEAYGNTNYSQNQTPQFSSPNQMMGNYGAANNRVDPNEIRSWIGAINDGVSLIGNMHDTFGGINNSVRNGFTPIYGGR